MKNSADLGGCYPPRPSALVDNTLLDLQNSSYPTQPHSIIAKRLVSLVKRGKIIVLHVRTHFSTNSCGTLHNNDVKSPI